MGELVSSGLGNIYFQEKEIIRFPKGIIGFSDYKNYILLGQEEPKPFIWLHSTYNSNLALVFVDPFVFFPDYRIIPNP